MTLEYVKVASYTKGGVCPHNNAVLCAVKNCYHCGWHPKVEKIRKDKLIGGVNDGK